MKVLGMVGIVGSIYAIFWGGTFSLLFLALGTVGAMFELIRQPKIPVAWWWGASFLGLWALAGLWSDFSLIGAWEKYIRIVTLTMWYVLIPPLIIKNQEDITKFLSLLMWGGLVLVGISIPSFLEPDGVRLSTFGANPIGLSRAFGVSILCLLFFAKKRKINLLFIVPLVLMMLSTGTKGTIIGLAVGIVFLFGLRIKWLTITGVLGFSSLKIGEMVLQESTWQRVSALWTGLSEPIRQAMYEWCMYFIPQNAMGYGVGYFSISGLSLYPHNYILETFLEAGWLAGVYLLVLLILGAYWLFKLRKVHPIYSLVLSIYLMEITLTMFTGDITGLKLFYIFLTLGAYHHGRFLANKVRERKTKSDTKLVPKLS